MIDLSTEQVITLTEAARRLPSRRQGRPVNLATVWRWAQHGIRGHVLDTLYVGGVRMTSVEAIQRFCDAITAAQDNPAPPAPPGARLSAARRKQLAQAQRELAAAGI